MFDLVIRSDRVVTPSGVAACDLAVQGEKIVAVGAAGSFGADTTQRLIDATGKWVTPGFLDTHTHYDAELIVSPSLSESVRHGVTTVLVGSCSLSMVCSPAEDASDIFTRVETVPREKVLPILHAHKTWRRPAEWVEFVRRQPLGPNLISFIGHSDMRVATLGLHRATDRIDLVAFWGRRARRLLPALVVVLVDNMLVQLLL